jgi:integrase
MSEKEARIAKATLERPVPTPEQIRHVLHHMPAESDIDLRNRAVIAFTLLTGARDGAIASFKLKHIDVGEGKVIQDAREVRTKFSKTFATWFFPVGDDVRQIAVDWVRYLETKKLFGPADPLFPATQVVQDQDRQFQAGGLSRLHWSNASPIRAIFNEAFTRAGLPYANPHSFRKTLGRLGQQLCRTPEEFKAWSQNLGHEQVLTTFSSYGHVAADRQADLIRHIGSRPDSEETKAEAIERAIKLLQDSRLGPR